MDHRETLGLDMQAIRLVWSESDGLPGVIVDRYGDHLVLQTLTLAMDQRKTTIAEALQSVIKPKSITERNDSPIRGAEGLESVKGLLFGSTPEAFDLQIGGLIYQVDMLEGQKTGLYLDQLANHAAVAELSKDLRVLDVFSHQGGFALACRQAGAAEVTGIEISASAVAAAQINATRNDLKVNFVKANAFDHLRELESQKASFDLSHLGPAFFYEEQGQPKRGLARLQRNPSPRAQTAATWRSARDLFVFAPHQSRDVYPDDQWRGCGCQTYPQAAS